MSGGIHMYNVKCYNRCSNKWLSTEDKEFDVFALSDIKDIVVPAF